MRIVTAADVERALDERELIERLRLAFREDCVAPVRTHHSIKLPGQPDATLLLMPAWQEGRQIGVKLATVFPGNAERGLPSVLGLYVLLDGATGQVLALLDAPVLTAKRTAAASALAATYLARHDASRLLMVGTGILAPYLIQAHATVRPLRRVGIWGRHPEKAAALAERLARPGMEIAAVESLPDAVRAADIISCATLARSPLIEGAWLAPGQHLDLVGGYTPEMREADDEAVRRARVFVDTRAGAGKEAGDIVQPLRNGTLAEDGIKADLFELCRNERMGRQDESDITLFKSVGAAIEDLAAARLALERLDRPSSHQSHSENRSPTAS